MISLAETELMPVFEIEPMPVAAPFPCVLDSEQNAGILESDADADLSDASSVHSSESDFNSDSFQYFEHETVSYYYFSMCFHLNLAHGYNTLRENSSRKSCENACRKKCTSTLNRYSVFYNKCAKTI